MSRRPLHRLVPLALLALVACAAPHAVPPTPPAPPPAPPTEPSSRPAQAPLSEVERLERLEVAFDVPQLTRHPDDVSIEARFTAPSGKVTTVGEEGLVLRLPAFVRHVAGVLESLPPVP